MRAFLLGNARRAGWAIATAAVVMASALPASAIAQVQSIDPNTAIDADLNRPATTPTTTAAPQNGTAWTTDGLTTDEAAATAPIAATTTSAAPGTTANTGTGTGTVASSASVTNAAASAGQTYHQDDLIGAAEGVFGRGAEGLGRIIENILREQGEPNGYIVGREAGGALVVGLRYGSGTLHHRIEGEMPVYWTGPSIGFDAGANAGSTFVLVYNLHDTADLYHRIPAGEGSAYLVGGFNASYLRRGDVVLIPIRLGVGARLGVNVGYMKFSRRQRWLPF
ncbi:MAG: DUF1134 domain-containing protein [Sphingopyxis sp.]